MGKTENRNRARREHGTPVDPGSLHSELARLDEALALTLRSIRKDTNMRIDLLQMKRRTDEKNARDRHARERAAIKARPHA